MPSKKCIVAYSGGQDSSTTLVWALEQFDYVETYGLRYGQRHEIELQVRKDFIRKYREMKLRNWQKIGDDQIIELDLVDQLSKRRLVNENDSDLQIGKRYIPGRNMLIFSVGSIVAKYKSIGNLATGVSETEYSGYSDCRDNSVKACQLAINLNMDVQIHIHTPLMYLDKAGVWELSHRLGGSELVELIVEDTHSCYAGDRENRHEWGYGCGSCDACRLRAKGWREFNAKV